jgi:hypothetical protein
MLNLTSSDLWALIYPSCACNLDEERSNFIRRLPNNMGSFALVISNEMADRLQGTIQTEHFYVQRIHADNLHYAVLWDAAEWRHSDERRMENAQRHIASDASYITKKVHEYRKELIVLELDKLKIFTKAKSYDLAEAITSKGEENYKEKTEQFHKAFKGVYENVNIYFPLEQVAKIIDTNNILRYDTQETTVIDLSKDEATHGESQEGFPTAGESSCEERSNLSEGRGEEAQG